MLGSPFRQLDFADEIIGGVGSFLPWLCFASSGIPSKQRHSPLIAVVAVFSAEVAAATSS